METVIIGASGNVGRALVKKFQNERRVYRVVGRAESYTGLFDGADDLFLLTPLIEEMVGITHRIVSEAKKAGVKRIVKLSALGADSKSASRILRWHGQAEEVVANSEIPHAFVRPNAFMQNFIQFYGPSIRARSVLALPAASSRVSFVDASDIAEACCQAFSLTLLCGQRLEVTGPEAVDFETSARLLTEATGREIRYVPVSEIEALAGMEKAGLPPWRCEALLELYAEYRAGSAERVVAAESPRRTLREFIFENRDHWGLRS